MAALEEYMKTHPSRAEDREALRLRVRELAASMETSQVLSVGSRSTVRDEA